MSYRGLKVAACLVFALYCGVACGATPPDLIVVGAPVINIPWGQVSSLAFSPDGKYLAVGCISEQLLGGYVDHNPAVKKGNTITCWHVADWKRVGIPLMEAFYRDTVGSLQLIWSADSTKLTIEDMLMPTEKGSATLLKLRSADWSIDGRRLLSTRYISFGLHAAISPDGGSYVSPTGLMARMKTLIASSVGGSGVPPTESESAVRPDEFSVCDSRTDSSQFSVNVLAEPVKTSQESVHVPMMAAYSSDGRSIAVSYGDRVCLVNVETRAVISRRRMSDTVKILRFQPNTQNLLVAYGDRHYQLLASPSLTPLSLPMTGDLVTVRDVQFVKSGKWFAVTNLSVKVNKSEMPLPKYFSTITMVETKSMKVFGKIGPNKFLHSGSLALSPDGSKVAWGETWIDMSEIFNFKGRLLVFRTSKSGGPSPDEWLNAHGTSSKPAVGKHPLAPKTQPGAAGH